MSQTRPRRRVTARRAPVRPREQKIAEQEVFKPSTLKEKFLNLPANSQIFYTKVATAVLFGIPSAFLYNISVIANNWFLIPLLALVIDIAFIRYVLKIDEHKASWLRVIFSGTITLFISFIVTSGLIWSLFFFNPHQYLT